MLLSLELSAYLSGVFIPKYALRSNLVTSKRTPSILGSSTKPKPLVTPVLARLLRKAMLVASLPRRSAYSS